MLMSVTKCVDNTTNAPARSQNFKYRIFKSFPSSKGITVKNHRTTTKFELDLYFLVKYLHMQFQPYTYIPKKLESGN